jgi:hypothetical protein
MAYGTVNADVIGTSVAGSNLGAGDASIMKNRIINGAMVIDQRNAGASVTPAASTYTLDRWNLSMSQASKLTIGQNLGGLTGTSLPIGFQNYLGILTASAVSIGAGDFFFLTQPIEGFNTADLGWGTANAKTVTLSFQVYSSLTGTFGGSITNSAFNRSYPFSYTILSANTWTTISVIIAGDTTGTWVGATNGSGLNLRFGLGVGSTYSGTAGSWSANGYFSATGATSVVGTNGATFYITGVQLEVGSSATGFEYVNYQTSLANCQRYYQQFGGATNAWLLQGYLAASSSANSPYSFPVTMRTTPTATLIGTPNYGNANSGTFNVASPYGGNIATTSVNAGSYFFQCSTTSYFTFSAEL